MSDVWLCAVKPEVVSSIQISENDALLKLDWVPPSGLVPEHCLEYEVESTIRMTDGREKQVFVLLNFFIYIFKIKKAKK